MRALPFYVPHYSSTDTHDTHDITDAARDFIADRWQTPADIAWRQLQDLHKSQPVNYLRAYHFNGQLIHPDDYELVLKGAVVLMEFSMARRSTILSLRPCTGTGLPEVFPKRVPAVRVRCPDSDTVPKPHPLTAVRGYARVTGSQVKGPPR